MPIYKTNGKTYNIPDDKVEAFEKRYPNAEVEIYDNDGVAYSLPLSKRGSFQKKYEKWSYTKQTGNASQEEGNDYDVPIGRVETMGRNGLRPFTIEHPAQEEERAGSIPATDDGITYKSGYHARQVADEYDRSAGIPTTQWKPTRQQKAAMIANMEDIIRSAHRLVEDSNERLDNLQEYGGKALGGGYGQAAEGGWRLNPGTGKMERTYLTPTGDRTFDKTAADAVSREYREAISEAEEARKRKSEEEAKMMHDPTLWESVKKSLGSGFLRTGAGLLDAMQALGSGIYVQDPSNPTGYTKTPSYEEALFDENNQLTKAIGELHDKADKMSEEAQPHSGRKGFLDMLWDGEIVGFLQKGIATTGESLPMTLSAFNPYTMALNAISMAGSNFRENTLKNPDIPAWKRAGQAIGSAAIEQAVEKYADPIFKYVGGRKILKGASKNASGKISTEITKDATETLAKRIYVRLKGLGKDALGEGAEEVLSNVGNDVLGEILDFVDGNEDYGLRAQWEKMKRENPDVGLWSFAKSKAKENVESFIGGAMAGAYTSGTAQLSTKALQYSFDKLGNGPVGGYEESILNPVNVDVAQSYDDGYSEEETAELQDTKNLYELRQNKIAEMLGVDAGSVDETIGDPVDFIGELQQLGRSDEIQPVLDYVNSKAKYDGMIQRVRDDIDGRIDQSIMMVNSRTNRTTGMIQGATLKVQDAEGKDRRVYVLDGNLATLPDGTGIDHENSDGSIIIRYADTGEMEMVSPDAIFSVEEPVNPETEKQAAAEAIRQQYGRQEANRIEGAVAFNPGDTYTLTGEDGQAAQIQIVANRDGIVDNGNGTVNVSSDGGQTIVPMSKEDIQAMVDATNRARAARLEEERETMRTELPTYSLNEEITLTDENGNAVRGSITADANEDGQYEVYTEAPVNGRKVNLFTAEDLGRLRAVSDENLQQNGEVTTGKFNNGAENIPQDDNIEPQNIPESAPQPVGRSLLGNIYNQFKGKTREAIEFLKRRKEGVAQGALHHQDIGDIDIVWGNKKMGLAHILDKHPNVVDGLQERIDEMDVVSRSENRIVLESNTHKAVISKMLGQERTPQWLLTAYEKKSASGGSSDIVPEPAGMQNGTAPLQDTLTGNEVMENPGDVQVNGMKGALERIPKNETGQPLYEQTDSETAWDAIVEQAGGDEGIAGEVAADLLGEKENALRAAEKELKKLQEGKPVQKKGSAPLSMEERIAAKKAAKEKLGQAQANVDAARKELSLWENIASTPLRRKQEAEAERRRMADEAAALRKAEEEKRRAEREEAERKEREALNGVPDMVDDKPQDARARGYRRMNGHKIDRQEPVQALQGKDVSVKFSDDVLVGGHAAVIDANLLQPSHVQGVRNPLHFIDEAQPKERNDEASVLSARKIAGNIRPEEITSSVTAYTGAPTVNARGEVIQGNNRSDALRQMWAGHPEQAETYKQYLKDHAEEFGLQAEDIEGMEHPVLVNMVDVDDTEAINLGQYVAQDTESGGIERIKPKNIMQKMGNDMRSFANLLLASSDEEISFAGLVDANGTNVLKWMMQKGYITPTQYSSAFDSKGNLTAEAKNDLRGIMYQSIFKGGSVRLEEMFNALPVKAQKAILATAFRDYDSPNAERMVEEIQNSIRAYYALSQDRLFAEAKNFKEARIAVESWKRQYQIDDATGESYLPADNFSNFALLLATMYKGSSQGFMQGMFAEIYDLVQGTQEATFFEEPDNTPRTLTEAINEAVNKRNELLYGNEKFEYDGQRRSNVLAGGGAQGQREQQGSRGDAQAGERVEDGTGTAERGRGTERNGGQRTASETHSVPQKKEINILDPQTMSDEEKLRRGDMLRNAPAIDVKKDIIKSTPELSARKAAEEWWDAHVGEPALYDTEVGEVEINKNSIESSLAHRYGQKKLDAITSLVDGFENAVYLGTLPDSRERGVVDHYFAFPINYNGERHYVFCRAMQDANKNRLYVHEVFVADKIKKGDTLQTAASKPHGGISLYRDILANVLDVPVTTSSENSQELSDSKGTNNSVTSSELGEKIAAAEAEVNVNPTEAQKEAGNYKKGHVQVGVFDITIEQPKGSVRSGVDANGNKWETTMQNTYGYIRGTEGVDGDHIDVFLSDDIDGWNGRRVFVVDQYNEDGSFDEHKVMLGFNGTDDAEAAYFANYDNDWAKKHKTVVTGVNLEDFEKWIDSSHRKTKPFAEYKGGNLRKQKADGEQQAVSPADAALRDALADRLRSTGIEVVTDSEAGQRVLDEANGNGAQIRLQARLSSLDKAAKAIHNWIARKAKGKVFTIELPEATRRMIRNVMGRDFDSHNITINGIRHGLDNHGVDGKKLNENSIPVREEDAELIPYIMTAPDYVRKGSEDVTGRESVRFYKTLSNGYVVVVEKEYKNSPDDMETITMWAEMSSEAINAQRRAVPDTHVQNAILSTDAAKIRKDAENAIRNEAKLRDHVRFFRTADGEAYGFTAGDKIYLDPKIATAETPVHEYAHLWSDALRRVNPEEWQNVVELMKDTPVWEEVKSLYPDLETDSEIADEVLAHYSGRRGAERLREAQRKIADEKGDVFDKARAISAIEQVKEALKRFWKGVADWLHIHFTTAEEVADKVMADLLNGVNPMAVDAARIDKKELIAVHNLSEKKLKDALELGGFPMPSIAITKADVGHTNFGEISLVFDKESINPSDRRNKVYGEDAWTPTFPEVAYKLNDKKTNDIYDRANKAGKMPIFNPVDFHPTNFGRHIDGINTQSIVDHFKDDYGAKQLFLSEKGDAVKEFVQKEVQKYNEDDIALYKKILAEIGIERLRNESAERLADDIARIVGEHRNIDFDKLKPNVRRVKISNARRSAIDYAENGNIKIENDIDATKRLIDERVNEKAFEQWLDDLFDGVVVKKGIRNDKDWYTPSGRSRNWEALYDEITLDNVVRAMQKQSARGGEGLFGGSIFGAAQEEYKDIDAIREAAKNRIRTMDEAEYDAKRNAITDRLSAVNIQGAGDNFSEVMDMCQNIQDAVARSHTPKGIHKYLKAFYPKVTMENAKEIADIVKDIQRMSARYFEAKPYRAVGFDEVKLAVVPSDTDANLVERLKQMGIEVKTYAKGDHAQRREIVDEATEKMRIRFQLVGEKGAANMDKAEEATVRLDNLSVAREMEKSDKDAKSIKLATGWERGADGKWRYEIMDGEFDRLGELHPERRKLNADEQKELNDAFDELMDAFEKGSLAYKGEIDEHTDMADIYEAGGMERKKAERLAYLENKESELEHRPKHLDDYLSNEELFLAYPQLRNIEVKEGEPNAGLFGNMGSFNPETNSIKLNLAAKDVLLHEVQHAIQHIEGFATGGNPSGIRQAKSNNRTVRRLMKKLLENLGIDEWLSSIKDNMLQQIEKHDVSGREFTTGYMLADSMDEINGNALRKKLDEANRVIFENNKIIGGEHNELTPEQHYHRLSGEVEARNAEKRMDMTEDERRNTLASETEDVAREDQIFIMNSMGGNLREGELAPGQEVSVVETSLEHGFKDFSDAKEWAKSNIARTYTSEETGGKGEIRISNTAIDKFLSESSVKKSENKDVHLSVLKVLPDVIRESVDAEQHADYKKGADGIRSKDNGINSDILVHRLYGAVATGDKVYRVKVTVKEDVRNGNLARKAYSYEATKIELLAGTLGKPNKGDAPNTNNSITVAKLLKGVEKSYSNGELLLPENENLRKSDDTMYRIREEAAPVNTGIGYKVFVLKNGELYPPMVANPNGEATPVGVWLDADAAPIAGQSKTGRNQVKAGGKGTQGGSGKLAYRPGWHLGVIPYALQFNRIDENGDKTLFPANFVWAEVEYANDVDYQEEAMSYGYNKNGKFQHSYAGLPRIPENGAYTYRTNPNPETDPWIITGAMRVKRLLTPSEVDEMVKAAGREPQRRQENAITDAEISALNAEIANDYRNGIGAYTDDEVSYENDPAAKLLGRSGRTAKQRREFAQRERQRMTERVKSLAGNLHLDNVEIVTDASTLEGKKQRAKGFYSKSTGKITIVVPNHSSVFDIEQTLLHEAVAHYGLRQLFGEHFDTFLDNVFNNAEESIRRRIMDIRKQLYRQYAQNAIKGVTSVFEQAEIIAHLPKNESDFTHTATEEYLASLAENTEFENTNASWWREIKELFLRMLHKIGFEGFSGVTLSDNELRYILWRSYENLAEPGRYRSILGEAADVAKQAELKVGNYTSKPSPTDPEVAEAGELEEVNERFNEELSGLTEENADKVVLSLGRPSAVLLSAGVSDKPMKLYGNKVVKKMKKHGFALDELQDLPRAVANPIAVFENYGKEDNRSVLTELHTEQGNFLVTLSIGQGHDIDFNIVTSVFGKGKDNIIDWFNRGFATYVDKQKTLDYLHHSALKAVTSNNRERGKALNKLHFSGSSIPEASDNAELSRAAKIVESFENPKVSDGKTRLSGVSEAGEVEEVNERFNEELEQQIEGKLPDGHIYEMGHPGNVLLSTGVPDLPIQMNAKRLQAKATSYGHDFDLSEVKDLVKALQHPLAVFAYGNKSKAQNIIVPLQKDGKNFIVGLSLNPVVGGRKLEINSIRNVFPKHNSEWLNWISQGKALYLDKEKIQTLINQQRTILADVDYLNLDSVTKVVENFENPVISHENISEEDVLYRDGDPERHERELARDRYEQRVKSGMYQSQEALHDSMLGLKEAMTAILGKRTYIEDVDGFENAYLGENRLSSVNKAEADAFAHLLFKPMLDEVAKLARTEAEREELTDYMMAKHGLERNTYMRNEAIHNGVTDAGQTDYAGLTALTGMDNVADAEAEAQRMVDAYEQAHDTTALWKKVNAVSKAILSKSYECGMMSKATFDKVSSMYDFYIPLRGFDEKTSSEAYAYLTHKQSAFNAPIKKAEGRRSKADDPFANLQSMAEGAIMQGNRNKLVKQRFLNFALNHPSDLVSVSDIWVEHDAVANEWKPVFPDNIDSTDPPEEVERKMQDFETKMESLAQQYPDRYKHGKDTVNIPYRIVESRDLRQHQIVVKRGGRDYVITINGNPRAAQAVNGQTNPDNDMSGAIGAILRAGENINRQLSAFYTTRNPDFIMSNFIRDMLYTNTMVWIKESPNYALRFHRNYMYANPVRIKQLLAKHRKGMLDMSDKTEAMFHQFMMNGGETGYANIRDIEQHKNDIRRELKKSNGKIPVKKAWDLLGERFDEYNRAVENCARFAAFMTSREMGRSIDRAIYDAKEISVNFNKKGSGAKFYGSTGQTKVGNASALVSGLGRSGYVFWNAAIQGTANFGRQMKRHPAKAFTGIAAMFILGAIVAYLNGDDDDEDDKNSYYNLPEHVRRSNILFRAGDSWVSIPLPVEYRAFYGMGELMVSVLNGKEHLTGGEIAEAIAGQATQILPIDFLEGGGGVNAFVPSAYKPLWEAYVAEKSWTGMPLYKDTPWNKDMPEWTKAYKSANKYIVGLANVMNEATGGDPYTKGAIDINPAKIEYMLNGYFGGVFGTIDKLSKTAETIAGDREYDPRSLLLVNRLVKAGDERTEYRAVNNEYFRLKEEHDRLKSRLKHYEEDTDNGIFDYAEKIDFLYNSPEYERYEIFEDYREDIDDLYNELKEAVSDEERKDIEAELNEVKKMMIKDMDDTRK